MDAAIADATANAMAIAIVVIAATVVASETNTDPVKTNYSRRAGC